MPYFESGRVRTAAELDGDPRRAEFVVGSRDGTVYALRFERR